MRGLAATYDKVGVKGKLFTVIVCSAIQLLSSVKVILDVPDDSPLIFISDPAVNVTLIFSETQGVTALGFALTVLVLSFHALSVIVEPRQT